MSINRNGELDKLRRRSQSAFGGQGGSASGGGAGGSHARRAGLGAKRRPTGDALTSATNAEIVAGKVFEMNAAPERERVRRVRRR